MIYNERDTRKEAVCEAAKQIMMAARTAPKGKGVDIIEIATVTGDDLLALAHRMREESEKRDMKFFLRDAGNIEQSDAVILIGTRRYMEQEGVTLPEQDYEDGHSKNGELQILYLAVSGNVHAMFVIRYVGGRNIARSLAALQQENIRLLVTSLDPSLTAKHITEAYRLPEGMVTLLDQEQCAALEAAPAEDAPCCMYHQKGFASLTGGLQAADQAQNAESSATTVQMVSVLFSIIIAALLTSAGSIWELSVATVLMYQAAWSALSLAVCALKQHNG